MKKRYFKKRPKDLPKGYDSKLEYRLHQTALKDAKHHPPKEERVPYTVPHHYEYDFYFELGDMLYILEIKGRFRDSTESSKYIHIRDHLQEWNGNDNVELLFIFENAKTAFPFAKRRKDGTKADHGEWASRHNFRWLCEKRGDLENVVTKEDLIRKFDEMN